MARQPLAEVFGFPIDNQSDHAERFRRHNLCPFNNKIPNCTKDKAQAPLGVCSVFDGTGTAITCPIRFRENWIIADDAAAFFFPPGTSWTSLTEVRLKDVNGGSAGNIDVVLVAYDRDTGKIQDFGALEIQAVYISGNIRNPFEYYMKDPAGNAAMDWSGQEKYPRSDYLSSSRKRLAPQLLFKGGILHAWNKKTAVALDKGFFETLPKLHEVAPSEAEVAWLVYDLALDKINNKYNLFRHKTVYTKFTESLRQITTSKPGKVEDFVGQLQEKLNQKLDDGVPPNNVTLDEIL
ncbi:MAG: hypothetical protein ING09_02080 [Roseomonas sp.]|nr:hypothetical protein [Roseomonas sp.]MCA3285313.1 hypothetical protein [Roseomonas sp.]MCA3288942.1 hypothetical protein [Roseomonas sp.]MCA3294840.1 hypothetical protein [Roseomonas sp.]